MEGEPLQSESESPQSSNCDRERSHECDQEDTGSLINPPSKSSETTLGESDASTRSDKEIGDLPGDSIEPYIREQRMSTGNGQGVNDYSDCTSTLQDHSVFGNEMLSNGDQEYNNSSANRPSMSSEQHIDENGNSSENPQDINHPSANSSPKSPVCQTVHASQIEVDNDSLPSSCEKPEEFRGTVASSDSDEQFNNPSVSPSVREETFQSHQEINDFPTYASNSTEEHVRKQGSSLQIDQRVDDSPLNAFQGSSGDVCEKSPTNGRKITDRTASPSSDSLHPEEERLPHADQDGNVPSTGSSSSTLQPTTRKRARPTKSDTNTNKAPDTSLYSSDRPVRKRGRPPKNNHKSNISSVCCSKSSEEPVRKSRRLSKSDTLTTNGAGSSSQSSAEPVNKGNRLSKNNKRQFQCTYCESVFSNGSNLIKHVRLHTGEKPYKCEFCGTAYSDISNFKLHVSNHTGKKPHKCTECERTFFRKSDSDIHMRTHTGERPYSCPRCKKAFPTSSCLNKHMVIHSDERKFKCLVCGASYKREANLEEHARRHTGEKPYKCGLCNDAFASRKALKQHMMRHTGEKPYKCDYCSAAYIQKGSLDSHLLTHEADVMFICGFCGVCYRTQTHLTRHKKIHHAVSLEVC